MIQRAHVIHYICTYLKKKKAFHIVVTRTLTRRVKLHKSKVWKEEQEPKWRRGQRQAATYWFKTSIFAECWLRSKETAAINCGPEHVQHINNQTALLTSLTSFTFFCIPSGFHYTWNPLWNSHKCNNLSRKMAGRIIADNLVTAVFRWYGTAGVSPALFICRF